MSTVLLTNPRGTVTAQVTPPPPYGLILSEAREKKKKYPERNMVWNMMDNYMYLFAKFNLNLREGF